MASRKKTTKTRAKARTAKRSTTRPKAAPKRAQEKGFSLRSVAPSFTVDDIQRSLTWYRDIMGFAVFRITDVHSNGVDGYAISGVYADMNDPALRRGQVARLVPWN